MGNKFGLVDRVEFIRNECVDKSVLHLGCTNYPYTKEAIEGDMLLHHELGSISKELYGLDFDPEGLQILSEAGVENLFRADLEKLEELKLERTFDVIIAGEMIEHLNNPGLFLEGIKRFMHGGSRLVITTINAYSAMRFAMYGLRGKGGPNEPVHPDHVAYYSYRTLKLTVERIGLELNQFYYYDVGPEHRGGIRWYYKAVNDLCVRFSPQLGDGVIAVCKLTDIKPEVSQ
jgi:SAM-dependent methyltransferase